MMFAVLSMATAGGFAVAFEGGRVLERRILGVQQLNSIQYTQDWSRRNTIIAILILLCILAAETYFLPSLMNPFASTTAFASWTAAMAIGYGGIMAWMKALRNERKLFHLAKAEYERNKQTQEKKILDEKLQVSRQLKNAAASAAAAVAQQKELDRAMKEQSINSVTEIVSVKPEEERVWSEKLYKAMDIQAFAVADEAINKRKKELDDWGAKIEQMRQRNQETRQRIQISRETREERIKDELDEFEKERKRLYRLTQELEALKMDMEEYKEETIHKEKEAMSELNAKIEDIDRREQAIKLKEEGLTDHLHQPITLRVSSPTNLDEQEGEVVCQGGSDDNESDQEVSRSESAVSKSADNSKEVVESNKPSFDVPSDVPSDESPEEEHPSESQPPDDDQIDNAQNDVIESKDSKCDGEDQLSENESIDEIEEDDEITSVTQHDKDACPEGEKEGFFETNGPTRDETIQTEAGQQVQAQDPENSDRVDIANVEAEIEHEKEMPVRQSDVPVLDEEYSDSIEEQGGNSKEVTHTSIDEDDNGEHDGKEDDNGEHELRLESENDNTQPDEGAEQDEEENNKLDREDESSPSSTDIDESADLKDSDAAVNKAEEQNDNIEGDDSVQDFSSAVDENETTHTHHDLSSAWDESYHAMDQFENENQNGHIEVSAEGNDESQDDESPVEEDRGETKDETPSNSDSSPLLPENDNETAVVPILDDIAENPTPSLVPFVGDVVEEATVSPVNDVNEEPRACPVNDESDALDEAGTEKEESSEMNTGEEEQTETDTPRDASEQEPIKTPLTASADTIAKDLHVSTSVYDEEADPVIGCRSPAEEVDSSRIFLVASQELMKSMSFRSTDLMKTLSLRSPKEELSSKPALLDDESTTASSSCSSSDSTTDTEEFQDARHEHESSASSTASCRREEASVEGHDEEGIEAFQDAKADYSVSTHNTRSIYRKASVASEAPEDEEYDSDDDDEEDEEESLLLEERPKWSVADHTSLLVETDVVEIVGVFDNCI
jgi:hypothetical protein